MSKMSRKANKLRKQSWDNKRQNKMVMNIFGHVCIVLLAIIIALIVFCCHRKEEVQPTETDTATAETDSEMSSLEETEEESSAEESETSEPVSETESETETVSETETSETTEESRTEKASSSASSTAIAKPQKKPTSQTKKPIKVTVTIKNIISLYGDEFKALDYEISAGNVMKSELSKYITLTKQAGKTVGQYWITGSCTNPMFDVTFIPGIYTINLRDVTIQAENKESYVGENLKDLTYTVSRGSIVNGDEVVKLYIDGDPTKVGIYDIKDKWKNPNYNLTVKVGKYTVKKKSSSSGSEETQTKPINVAIKILDKSSYYGNTIVDPDFSITKGNVKKSELSKYITLKKEDGNNVGSYSITAKCKDTGGKYKITVENGTYTIKARKLSIEVDNKESFVGDGLETLTYTVKSGSVVAGDEVIEFSTNADPSKAGTYDITAKSKNSNYDVKISNKGVYTVKERPRKKAIVQILHCSSVYGEPISDYKQFTISGDITMEEMIQFLSITKEDGSNVGDYPLNGTCSNPEWDVTVLGATYTITSRPLSVKAEDVLIYQGEAIPNELPYTITSGSIVAGDSPISVTTQADPNNIGEYPIVVIPKNSNYDIQVENAILRVKAKPQPPKDEEEEVEGDKSSSSPSETEEGPKEEEVKPSQPTPSSPVDGPSDAEEDVEPNKPTPSAPKESELADDESEVVLPTTATP